MTVLDFLNLLDDLEKIIFKAGFCLILLIEMGKYLLKSLKSRNR
jgi:hypothetical protein